MGEYFNKQVFKAVWPICFGYIPLGVACGILGEKVGLDAFLMAMMSIFLFAGSGQFIALAMIGAGTAIIPIVITVGIVNLRHMLYGLILNQHISKESLLYRMIYAQEIVDETFAVNSIEFQKRNSEWNPKKAAGLNFLAHMSWMLATVAGVLLGSAVYIDTGLVSYALIAMFIGLWSFHFKSAKLIGIGVLGGGLALLLSLWLDNMLNVVVATVVAAIVGAAIDNGEGVEKK
ncbi:MAG: AzlC family ABC transporter permease [Anaerovibrio sp.]|jgi:4-azaleucine resistance transporter AzlC|uniref:Branched-chain amino acid ABC transporter permease n=2 Tax=Anaerovibrio lipolyticus TaxID=82374 RepID=A0A0B2JMV1_9FIRM|nr:MULTISPECIES: AzlC family ABC transporter permease [Anaerovibrio]KHM49710.1 hypothetical protein NZ47_12435 [Anaerovibrio lipolyticus]MBO6246844.1 AzlC family ABC transporter permease [Anaerovibrio sp.]SHJ10954.1 4-azaleucine resistance probable transporter AzlC [Anaerovibrio lipolyticus DSM 3074]